MMWKAYHPRAFDFMGLIPEFLSEDNPEGAAAQFEGNYKRGGGWCPLGGWVFDPATNTIKRNRPQRVHKPVAETMLRDERIIVYPRFVQPWSEHFNRMLTEEPQVINYEGYTGNDRDRPHDAWVAIVQPDGKYEVARMD